MAGREQKDITLQEEDVKVQLEPASAKKKWGAKIAGAVTGGIAGWAISKKLSDRFLSQVDRRDISLDLDTEDVEVGEAKDLRGKKVDRVILTDDAIHMFYKTGTFRKTCKMLSFPLEYVADLSETGKIMKKVQITLDLPKDKVGRETEKFNLKLGVDDRSGWVRRLKIAL